MDFKGIKPKLYADLKDDTKLQGFMLKTEKQWRALFDRYNLKSMPR